MIENKETVYLVPGSACKDCSYVINTKERQVENTARILVIEGVLPTKINWSTFKWIIGGIVAAAILVIAANFTMLTVVSNNQHRMELSQVAIAKDLESLTKKFEVAHK
jgi:hypothetical protein